MNYSLVRKVHRTVALVFSLFFLLVALSGIILNHSYPRYRPALAGDLPERAVFSAYRFYGSGQNDLVEAENLLAPTGGAKATGGTYLAGAPDQDFSPARYGVQGGGPGGNGGGGQGVGVPAAGSQRPPTGDYAPNLWKFLHTGRFLGLSSLVCDLTALAMIVTVLTGLYLYFYGLRRKRC